MYCVQVFKLVYIYYTYSYTSARNSVQSEQYTHNPQGNVMRNLVHVFIICFDLQKQNQLQVKKVQIRITSTKTQMLYVFLFHFCRSNLRVFHFNWHQTAQKRPLDSTETAIKRSTDDPPLPTDDVMELLTLCLTSIYFQYSDKHYKHAVTQYGNELTSLLWLLKS